MDASRFDALARALTAPRSRRGAALSLIGGLLNLGAPAFVDAGKGGGKKKKKKKQKKSDCVAAGKFCTSSNECCDGLPCTRSKCAQPAGGPCTSDIQCVGELYLQYCRSNRCCAVQFGYCEKPADCCDPTHTCSGSSCSL